MTSRKSALFRFVAEANTFGSKTVNLNMRASCSSHRIVCQLSNYVLDGHCSECVQLDPRLDSAANE